jgi:hypothetical protein
MEFALMRVRPARVELLARRGSVAALAVQEILSRFDEYLAAMKEKGNGKSKVQWKIKGNGNEKGKKDRYRSPSPKRQWDASQVERAPRGRTAANSTQQRATQGATQCVAKAWVKWPDSERLGIANGFTDWLNGGTLNDQHVDPRFVLLVVLIKKMTTSSRARR